MSAQQPYFIPRSLEELAELIRENGRRAPSVTMYIYFHLSLVGEDYIMNIWRGYREFLEQNGLNLPVPKYSSFRITISLLRRAGLVVNTRTERVADNLSPRQFIALSDEGRNIEHPGWRNIYAYVRGIHVSGVSGRPPPIKENVVPTTKPRGGGRAPGGKRKRKRGAVEVKAVVDEDAVDEALKSTFPASVVKNVDYADVLRKLCSGGDLTNVEVYAIANPRTDADPEVYVRTLMVVRKLSEERRYLGLLWDYVMSNYEVNDNIRMLIDKYLEMHGYSDVSYLEAEADYLERDEICGM